MSTGRPQSAGVDSEERGTRPVKEPAFMEPGSMTSPGVSRSVAMKIPGHKTETIYHRYPVVDRRAIEGGLKKVHEFRRKQAEKRSVVALNKQV